MKNVKNINQSQDMTEKYNKLLRKSKIDESDYENWDPDLVCDWIINLDKAYDEDTLRANIKTEDIDGSVLHELDRNDLHRLGVTKFKHKCNYGKIKLTEKSQQIAIPQMNEGNNAAPTAYINKCLYLSI